MVILLSTLLLIIQYYSWLKYLPPWRWRALCHGSRERKHCLGGRILCAPRFWRGGAAGFLTKNVFSIFCQNALRSIMSFSFTFKYRQLFRIPQSILFLIILNLTYIGIYYGSVMIYYRCGEGIPCPVNPNLSLDILLFSIFEGVLLASTLYQIVEGARLRVIIFQGKTSSISLVENQE